MKLVIGFSSQADRQVSSGGYHDAVFNQATQDIHTAGGGVLEIEVGTYNFSSPWAFPKDAYMRISGEKYAKGSTGGVTLRAATAMNSLIRNTGNPNPLTNADLSHDIHFENITFQGNNNVQNVIYLTNTDTITFNACRVIGGINGIVADWDSTQDPTAATIPGGLRISDSILSATTGTALDLSYQTQCWFDKIWFSGMGTNQAWIKLKSCNKIRINLCEFNSAQQAFLFEDTASFACSDITISNSQLAMAQSAYSSSLVNTKSGRILFTGCIKTPSVQPVVSAASLGV